VVRAWGGGELGGPKMELLILYVSRTIVVLEVYILTVNVK
jgi:hypothetical protein